MVSMTWPQYLRRECSYKDWVTKLTPQEAEVLAVLLVRKPCASSPYLLSSVVWDDDDRDAPLLAYGDIKRLIARLRAKLPGAIAGRGNFGYYMKLHRNLADVAN